MRESQVSDETGNYNCFSIQDVAFLNCDQRNNPSWNNYNGIIIIKTRYKLISAQHKLATNCSWRVPSRVNQGNISCTASRKKKMRAIRSQAGQHNLRARCRAACVALIGPWWQASRTLCGQFMLQVVILYLKSHTYAWCNFSWFSLVMYQFYGDKSLVLA